MSKTKSNALKDKLLGEPHGTATSRLRKSVLFKYVKIAGHDICHRCAQKIEHLDDLSIDHITSWQSAVDPVNSFFDLNNISFSHLTCNVNARDKSRFISRHAGKRFCHNGHEFTEENTKLVSSGRECRQCARNWMKNYRANLGGVGKRSAT